MRDNYCHSEVYFNSLLRNLVGPVKLKFKKIGPPLKPVHSHHPGHVSTTYVIRFSSNHRKILYDWVLEVVQKYNKPIVYFRTVDTMDKVLKKDKDNQIGNFDLQIFACACMSIQMDIIEDGLQPEDFVYLSAYSFGKDELLKTIDKVTEELNYDFLSVNAFELNSIISDSFSHLKQKATINLLKMIRLKEYTMYTPPVLLAVAYLIALRENEGEDESLLLQEIGADSSEVEEAYSKMKSLVTGSDLKISDKTMKFLKR